MRPAPKTVLVRSLGTKYMHDFLASSNKQAHSRAAPPALTTPHFRFIYPFLDAHKPYAWLSYLGLYAVHWAAFLAWWALACAKERALGARSAAQRSRLAGVKRD